MMCAVCWNAPKTHLFDPCRHVRLRGVRTAGDARGSGRGGEEGVPAVPGAGAEDDEGADVT